MTTMTSAEENTLWEQFAATGSSEVRDQLVLQSVPLVHYLLGRMGITREIGSDYDDLVHQGLLGLIDAVNRYDLSLGTRFSTFAGIRIRGKILDYMRANDWMSRSVRRRVRTIQNTVTAFWGEHQREPSDAELAEAVGLDIEDVQQALADSNRVIISLDRMMDDSDDETPSLHERQADENQPDPGEISAENEMKAQLVRVLKQLPEREQLVLSLYYFEELTFREIGKVLDVSESRVCQLHARAIYNVKALMTDE